MIHVVPYDEWKAGLHATDTTTCRCGVRIDWTHGVAVHRSFDGREVIAEAERIVNPNQGEQPVKIQYKVQGSTTKIRILNTLLILCFMMFLAWVWFSMDTLGRVLGNLFAGAGL